MLTWLSSRVDFKNFYQNFTNHLFQTYLVTGGYTGSEVTSTTEILTLKEGKVWQIVGNLPRPGNGLRATTVNNVIYLLGRNTLRLNWGQSNLSLKGEIRRYCSSRILIRPGETSLRWQSSPGSSWRCQHLTVGLSVTTFPPSNSRQQ